MSVAIQSYSNVVAKSFKMIDLFRTLPKDIQKYIIELSCIQGVSMFINGERSIAITNNSFRGLSVFQRYFLLQKKSKIYVYIGAINNGFYWRRAEYIPLKCHHESVILNKNLPHIQQTNVKMLTNKMIETEIVDEEIVDEEIVDEEIVNEEEKHEPKLEVVGEKVVDEEVVDEDMYNSFNRPVKFHNNKKDRKKKLSKNEYFLDKCRQDNVKYDHHISSKGAKFKKNNKLRSKILSSERMTKIIHGNSLPEFTDFEHNHFIKYPCYGYDSDDNDSDDYSYEHSFFGDW